MLDIGILSETRVAVRSVIPSGIFSGSGYLRYRLSLLELLQPILTLAVSPHVPHGN